MDCMHSDFQQVSSGNLNTTCSDFQLVNKTVQWYRKLLRSIEAAAQSSSSRQTASQYGFVQAYILTFSLIFNILSLIRLLLSFIKLFCFLRSLIMSFCMCLLYLSTETKQNKNKCTPKTVQPNCEMFVFKSSKLLCLPVPPFPSAVLRTAVMLHVYAWA